MISSDTISNWTPLNSQVVKWFKPELKMDLSCLSKHLSNTKLTKMRSTKSIKHSEITKRLFWEWSVSIKFMTRLLNTLPMSSSKKEKRFKLIWKRLSFYKLEKKHFTSSNSSNLDLWAYQVLSRMKFKRQKLRARILKLRQLRSQENKLSLILPFKLQSSLLRKPMREHTLKPTRPQKKQELLIQPLETSSPNKQRLSPGWKATLLLSVPQKLLSIWSST